MIPGNLPISSSGLGNDEASRGTLSTVRLSQSIGTRVDVIENTTTGGGSCRAITDLASKVASTLGKGVSLGAKGGATLIGGALYGASVIANGGITLACYLPAIVFGTLGYRLGYLVDSMMGTEGAQPAAEMGRAAFGGVPALLGIVAGASSLIVRGPIAAIGIIGACLLKAGLGDNATADFLGDRLEDSLADCYFLINIENPYQDPNKGQGTHMRFYLDRLFRDG